MAHGILGLSGRLAIHTESYESGGVLVCQPWTLRLLEIVVAHVRTADRHRVQDALEDSSLRALDPDRSAVRRGL